MGRRKGMPELSTEHSNLKGRHMSEAPASASVALDEAWIERQLARFAPDDMDGAVAQMRSYRHRARAEAAQPRMEQQGRAS